MRPPFPGMDPWLEDRAIWPDVHNRLISAMAESIAPRIAPRYYTRLEQRIIELSRSELALVGVVDLAIITDQPPRLARRPQPAGTSVLEVDVPVSHPVRETYLKVYLAGEDRVVTIAEVLSPTNKQSKRGRRVYERKRGRTFESLTNFVEVDLLRAGVPMPVLGPAIESDYRILVSRGLDRPSAQLYPFTIRDPIPPFPVPLLPGDDEPEIDLGSILHGIYDRSRLDLGLKYGKPPKPPLDPEDAAWATDRLSDWRAEQGLAQGTG